MIQFAKSIAGIVLWLLLIPVAVVALPVLAILRLGSEFYDALDVPGYAYDAQRWWRRYRRGRHA